jgi:glycerol kinase
LGTGCVRKGQVKVSLGTGTFLDLNTAGYVHASLKGACVCLFFSFRSFIYS